MKQLSKCILGYNKRDMPYKITATNFKTKEIYNLVKETVPYAGDVIFLGEGEDTQAVRIIAKSVSHKPTTAKKKKTPLPDSPIVQGFAETDEINLVVVPVDIEESLMTILHGVMDIDTSNQQNAVKDITHWQDVMRKYLTKIGWVKSDINLDSKDC
jgi:hypothetical protein